jgi:hypothetical protein
MSQTASDNKWRMTYYVHNVHTTKLHACRTSGNEDDITTDLEIFLESDVETLVICIALGYGSNVF